jgi:hypothetical protein
MWPNPAGRRNFYNDFGGGGIEPGIAAPPDSQFENQ